VEVYNIYVSIHFLNGSFVHEDDLKISVRDIGFTRGYAIFDFLITYPTRRPFKLSRHIGRLYNSASLIELSMPWEKTQVRNWVIETLSKNEGADDKGIKILISGGVSNTLIPDPTTPTIAIVIDPHKPFPKEYYENGVNIITTKHTRYTPDAKTNNYIEAVRQIQAAQKIGAIEPVYYNDLQVFEGSNSNIFALVDGCLITPRSNILGGITREVLLEILKLPVSVEERDFTHADLMVANEVFLTSSNKEVMPVTKIDEKPVGTGRVGNITKEAMKQFRDYTLSNEW
jgi:branched-chain amino acid aminotransferase